MYTQNENSFHLLCKPNSTELSNRAVISYVAILRKIVFATFIDIYYHVFNLIQNYSPYNHLMGKVSNDYFRLLPTLRNTIILNS